MCLLVVVPRALLFDEFVPADDARAKAEEIEKVLIKIFGKGNVILAIQSPNTGMQIRINLVTDFLCPTQM